jgi:hypothetical protein
MSTTSLVNIVESGVKYHKPKPKNKTFIIEIFVSVVFLRVLEIFFLLLLLQYLLFNDCYLSYFLLHFFVEIDFFTMNFCHNKDWSVILMWTQLVFVIYMVQ